jgi:hypothetical protein
MLDAGWGIAFLPAFIILPAVLYVVLSWYSKILREAFSKEKG